MANEVVACVSCGAKNRVPRASSGRPTCGKCHADLPWLVDATETVVGAQPEPVLRSAVQRLTAT